MEGTEGMTVKRRRRYAALAAALAAVLVAGCGADPGAAGGAGDDPDVIRIGLLSTLEGPFKPLGEAANQGAKLALLEAGGTLTGTGPLDTVVGATVGGKPVELFIEGSNNVSPDIAVNAARRLVDERNVDVIVGPTSGDEGLALKNYMLSEPDVTLVNGTAAAQNMTLRDPVPNVFRFSTDGAQWMAGLGTYAFEELGYQRVATVAEDYSYPYDQVGGFLTEYCAAGGQVVERVWTPLGTNDFASYIDEIPADIDAVYVALGGTDAVNFIRQLDEFTNRPDLPIVAGSLTVDPAIIQELGSRVEGVVSAGPVAVLNTPEYQQYAAALKQNFPDSAPPGFADVLYYVAMKSVLMALEESGGDATGDQAAFRSALAGLSFDTPQGPVKLDENRQVIANNYLFKVTNGQSTLVRPVPAVTQTLGTDADEYTAQAAFDRSNPACEPPPAAPAAGAPASGSGG
jgi:branched-chain amino acid transport system substrate-binding protein